MTYSEQQSAIEDLARAISCGDADVYQRMFNAMVETFGEGTAGKIDDEAAIVAATEESQ